MQNTNGGENERKYFKSGLIDYVKIYEGEGK